MCRTPSIQQHRRLSKCSGQLLCSYGQINFVVLLMRALEFALNTTVPLAGGINLCAYTFANPRNTSIQTTCFASPIWGSPTFFLNKIDPAQTHAVEVASTRLPLDCHGVTSQLPPMPSDSGIYATHLGGQLPACFISRISSVVRFDSARNCGLKPPFHALRRLVALPSGVVGPAAFSHGLHRLICSACRALRSGVHPFPIVGLQ
jgi:hypothetical protein